MKKMKLLYLLLLLLLFSACSTEFDILMFPSIDVTLEVGEVYDLAPDSNRVVSYEVSNLEVLLINGDVLTALAKGSATVTATAGIREVMIFVTVVAKADDTPPIVPPIEDDTPPLPATGTMTVHFIDVGQGDCILVQLPNGENLMIDAGKGLYGGSGSWSNIYSTLTALDVKIIDHLIITHNHSDHYELVPDVIREFEVLNVYGSGSTRTNKQYLTVMGAISAAEIDYHVVSVGDKIIDEEGLMLQVVSTQKIAGDPDPNIASVMTRLLYNEVAFMFTGDGGFSKPNDAEYIALDSELDLRSDVLKVGHHGSANSSSTDFLAAVGAKYGVITTAPTSSTGHPFAETLARLATANVEIYQSKDNGNIVFKTNGVKILSIETDR